MHSVPAIAKTPPAPPPSPAVIVTGTKRMVFDLDEGEATFTYPSAFSGGDVDMLEEWFKLVIKRMKRSAKDDDHGENGTSDDDL